ncbi:MAG: family 1 glycosylhydrolase [Actinobacteria bacterium]|nr:family 1 glycosylhydrolase [Actinomycetota bacterium]
MSEQLLPEGFRFGVATAGFQIEGGFNGPGEPANNWSMWEASGRVEPSGMAIGFWDRYEEQLDRVAAMGCDSFRLSVEWARVEPEEGKIDETAIDHYRAILAACRERGLEPLVTLHHFTHPSWLGETFWLRPDSPLRFSGWVDLIVGRIADLCDSWVTINEINALAMGSYLFGIFPPGRLGCIGEMAAAMEHMVTAHVKAYEVVHGHQSHATVGTNTACVSVFELDRVINELLTARSQGVDREGLGAWLSERRRRWYDRLPAPGKAESLIRSAVEAVFHRRLGSPTSPAVEAVYSSSYDLTLDVVQLDYYDPVASHHIRYPGHRSAGGRVLRPARMLWDDVVDPQGLVTYSMANAVDRVPVWVVENGLCNRVKRGRSYPRGDGWDRPRYIKENLAAVVAAIRSGVPLGAYFHWTLADNYEWGSYEPRFGLLGVDRERGCRLKELDSMGQDSAGAYGSLIASLRRGDTSVLD